MNGHELICALQSLPDELLDLQVKFDDDGHPQTVVGAYFDDFMTNPGDSHIKLVSGEMPRRFGEPLFADDWLRNEIAQGKARDVHVDFSDAKVQTNYDPDTKTTAVTLVVMDAKNLSVHTGHVLFGLEGGRRKVVTNSPSWRFEAALEAISKALGEGGYENRSATLDTFEEMRRVALVALAKEVGEIERIDAEQNRADMEFHAMRMRWKASAKEGR